MTKENSAENKKDMCIVIMPDNDDCDLIYTYGIKASAPESELEFVRVNPENIGGGNQVAAIIENIFKAKLVVMDLSGSKKEILYELGIAHGLLKPVIMIAKDKKDLPFDLTTYEVIDYPDIEGKRTKIVDKIKDACRERIKTVDQWREKSNPVFIHLKPDQRPVEAAEHQIVADKLKLTEKKAQSLENADGLLKEANENYSKLEKRIAELEKKNAELQGVKKFSESFFTRFFGSQVKDMSFDEIMRMFERKIEEGDGEVVVENSKGKRKKLKFRKLGEDERIDI